MTAYEGWIGSFPISELGDNYEFYDYSGDIDLTVEEAAQYSSSQVHVIVGNYTSLLDMATMSHSNKVLLAVFVIIFLVGLLGNLSVVYVMARFREARDVTMIYLSNLSLAQLVYMMVCMPLASAQFVNREWPLGQVACE